MHRTKHQTILTAWPGIVLLSAAIIHFRGVIMYGLKHFLYVFSKLVR